MSWTREGIIDISPARRAMAVSLEKREMMSAF